MSNGRHSKKAGHRLWPAVVLVITIAVLFVVFKFSNVQERLRDSLVWMESLGPTGAAVFGVIYILACVLFLPGSILTLGAGVLFGVVKGSIIVSIASTLGATAAFVIGRYLARNWVASKVGDNRKFKAVDEAVAREGWKIVGLTRLSPVFPFNLLYYAFGLTKVSLKHYFLASWIGMLPGTVMYVYIGSLAGSLAAVGAGDRSRTPMEWVFYIVGLIATIVVTVLVTKTARRALTERISEQKPEAIG